MPSNSNSNKFENSSNIYQNCPNPSSQQYPVENFFQTNLKNPQSPDRTKQRKIFSLSHAGRRIADIQKRQYPKPRKLEKKFQRFWYT